jgi:hypothetical protein
MHLDLPLNLGVIYIYRKPWSSKHIPKAQAIPLHHSTDLVARPPHTRPIPCMHETFSLRDG